MLILYSPPFFMRVSASEKPGTTCATCIGACSFASKTVPSSSLPSYLTSTTSALVWLGPVPSLMTSNPMRGVMCQANAAATPMSASTPSHRSHNPPLLTGQPGRASCRERACQYVLFLVVAVSLKTKNHTIHEKKQH